MGNEASKIKGRKHEQGSTGQDVLIERAGSAPTSLPAQRPKLGTTGSSTRFVVSRVDTSQPTDDEASTLRRRLKEAEGQQTKLDEERQRHIAKLQTEWEKEIQESQSQRRVVELRTQERDEAHKLLAQLGDEVKQMEAHFNKLEERRKGVDAEAALKRGEMEELIARQEKELEGSRLETHRAAQQVELLHGEKTMLSEELDVVKKESEWRGTELETTKRGLNEAAANEQASERRHAALIEDLNACKTSHARELESTRAELNAATGKVKALAREKDALADDLAKIRTEAAEQLIKAEEDTAAQLAQVQAAAAAESAVAAASAREEPTPSVVSPAQDIAALESELAATKAALAAATSGSGARSPVSSPERFKQIRRVPSYQNEFSEPVSFSNTPGEDFRVGVQKREGSMRVDIREWDAGVRSRRGVAITVKDAQELLGLLPLAIRRAEV